MSNTKTYLQELEERFADTFYSHYPDAYQETLRDLASGALTHREIEIFLLCLNAVPGARLCFWEEK